MNTLRQSPEKMRAMREALKRSTNPPADAMMYAEFAALPLNLFLRVCSFVEQDWFMFGACREKAHERQHGKIKLKCAVCNREHKF